jgi:hypothetical protein
MSVLVFRLRSALPSQDFYPFCVPAYIHTSRHAINSPLKKTIGPAYVP